METVRINLFKTIEFWTSGDKQRPSGDNYVLSGDKRWLSGDNECPSGDKLPLTSDKHGASGNNLFWASGNGEIYENRW